MEYEELEPQVRYRKLKTAQILFGMFTLGLSASIIGPTVVTIGYMLNATTEQMSMVFLGFGFGFTIGTFLGGVLITRMNPELLLMLGTAGFAVSGIVAPFSTHLWLFIGMCVVYGIFIGTINTDLNAYGIQLWSGEKKLNSVLQAIHCFYALGMAVCPVIIEPFIHDLPADPTGNNSTLNPNPNGHNESRFIDRVEAVRVPYAIVGLIAFVSSVTWGFIFVLQKWSISEKTVITRHSENKPLVEPTEDEKKFKRTFVALLCTFYFFFMLSEGLPAALFATYVVKGLGWPNEEGAIITFVFSASFCLTRILGIFIVAFTTPFRIMVVDLTLMVVGTLILLFAPYLDEMAWCAAVVLGVGMAMTFAAGIAWAKKYVKLSPSVVSGVLTAGGIGNMVAPAAAAVLFDELGYTSFNYYVIVAVFITVASFVANVIYARKHNI